MKQFNELGIQEGILKALNELEYLNPTKVQEEAIPALLKGDDIIILSQTGSGKTFAFGIPALQSINPEIKQQQALIICPTRELATQVSLELKKLTKYMQGVKVFAIFGGQPIYKQIDGLKTKPQIIVGTPGRIIDHIERKTLKLESVKMLVLDEADEMLKMGFREDIEEISKKLAGHRQGVLASATMSDEIKNLTKQFLVNPITIDAGNSNSPAKNIKQEYIAVKPKHKREMLVDILQKLDGTALVFCNTKKMTTELFEHLNENNIAAREIHGDMRQNERTKAMNAFKSGQAKILVATDVAARGIDVNNITYVINYDYPQMEEYYIHRIGRTGRAGNNGLSYTFITTSNQMSNLTALSKRLGFTITNSPLSGNLTYEANGSTDVSMKKGKKSSTGRSNEKRSYDRRDNYSNKNNKRTAKKDDNSYEKPYNNKRSYASSDVNLEKSETSYFKKAAYVEREDRSEKAPYVRRERSFNKPSYNKTEGKSSKPSYTKREDGFKKERSFDKPFVKREDGLKKERSFDKPYAKREDGFKKERSFDKPYAKRENSYEKAPYEKKERSFDKPFVKREDGFKKERSFDKPYAKRENSFEKAPYEKKERSFDKPSYKKK